VHVAEGGRIVDFAGWEMPVQYTGVLAEHAAVRQRAGLFDVSHMGEITVAGPKATDFLQRITSNDVKALKVGRAHYTALTTPAGTFVDDLLIYKLAEDDYLLVVNAGNTPKDADWVLSRAQGEDVEACDVSADWMQIAVQGPKSLAILEPLVNAPIGTLRYYGFVSASIEGVKCIVSRTGYTGEDGFEVYGPAAAAERIWKAIRKSGEPHGLIPAGLGARDTLRLEAKMALYGNDIDDATTVLEADLGWIAKLDKGDFIGRDVLLRQKEQGLQRKLVGFETEGRAVARHGYKAFLNDEEVGVVTSGSFAPTLGKNIGLAYLPPSLWGHGSRFDVEIRGRCLPAVVVPTPFYARPR